MRRFGGLVLALLLGGAAPALPQYFGQTKVQYKSFSFQVIQTEHFDIYFYEQERTAALDAARMAERSYARLSRILHREFQARKPIILYASNSDFNQTNAIAGDLGEGTEGVTEQLKHRMVLPFTGSYAELQHVLQHEMVHQFQFDEFSRGEIGGGLATLSTVAPPLWFMEGMAEYLSLGPIDPYTAMWLRDAALEGNLPTIEQMTFNPRIFPYYYGHALWAYIGERWGDEVIGEILQASVRFGVEAAFKRVLGKSVNEVSEDWRDAVQTTVLPSVSEHYRARRIAKAVLTEERSGGTLHLAPALTPDGKDIAFLGEGNSFFVDLYLADARSGHVKRRLIKSTVDTHYESLRFVNSAGSFSPDGQYFAIAVKHNAHDELVIFDVKEDREAARIKVPVDEMTSPTWAPDGGRLAFTGYSGGWSDLYIVNRDGSGLQRLTDDRYADFEPAWSPDGKTIAFATDRGPSTDFATLRVGNLRLALYHVETGKIELLPHMDYGANINPVWSPDGRSLAFVSDRTEIANIFLFDFSDNNVYQLTDVWSGVQGLTRSAPCLSWARNADRLAFAYYEDGGFNVYTIDNPTSLRRQPYPDTGKPPTFTLLAPSRRDTATATPILAKPTGDEPRASASLYRSESGLRASALLTTVDSSPKDTAAISISALLDSATLALPDTAEFTIHPYHTRFTTDFVARPTVGYQRDNFGRGIFGGTSVALSDMLGNRTLFLGGALNGRVDEAQVTAVYQNLGQRTNYALGLTQTPWYFYVINNQEAGTSGLPPGSTILFSTAIRRLVIRDGFGIAFYPFSRFTRLEFGVHLVDVGQSTLVQQEYYNPIGNSVGVNDQQTLTQPDIAYVSPTLSWVHDNSLFGIVGPFSGARDRLEVAPAIGGWRFTYGMVDLRRYLSVRPFTLAVRTAMIGRFGPDAGVFPIFLGNTDLMRGYTAGSFLSHECLSQTSQYPLIGVLGTGNTGCGALDQLIGSRVAVGNVELRFPLTPALTLGFLPPLPVEGAIFYDAGIAWNNGSQLKWNRSAADNPEAVRIPLRSWGASVRFNFYGLFIMRIDYAKPLDRDYSTPYVTLSVGQTF